MECGGHPCTFTTITTRSPSSHLDIALAVFDNDDGADRPALSRSADAPHGPQELGVGKSADLTAGPVENLTDESNVRHQGPDSSHVTLGEGSDADEQALRGVRLTRLQLADFESERSFQTQVKSHLFSFFLLDSPSISL